MPALLLDREASITSKLGTYGYDSIPKYLGIDYLDKMIPTF